MDWVKGGGWSGLRGGGWWSRLGGVVTGRMGLSGSAVEVVLVR